MIPSLLVTNTAFAENAEHAINPQTTDALSYANTLPAGTFAIASTSNVRYLLDVNGGSLDNGANIQLYNNNASSAQRWKITQDQNGYLTFQNIKSGKVLDVYGGQAISSTNVQQYASNHSKAQQWVAEGSRDDFILHSALDWNLVLDLAGGSLSNHSNIQIYKSNNSAEQHWKLDSSNYMQGAIESYHSSHNALGKPIGLEQSTAHGAYQNFQNGTVYWNRGRNTAYTLKGCIRSKYNTEGGAEGWLGYPTSEERKLKNGASQSFENGQIHWHAGDNHTHATHGAIQSYWASQNWENGWLGYPTSDEQKNTHGSNQQFQGGTVLGKNGSGAFGMKGCIRSKYNTEGGAEGWLGYPTSEERKLKNGASQSFENGQIHWHAGDNHTHATHGAIQSYWASQNWENGWLGYPTSDEQTNSKGASQQFQGGEVLYYKDGSTVPSIQAKWEELGGANGKLGAPTDSVTVKTSQGYVKSFANGIIFATSQEDKNTAYIIDSNIYAYWNKLGGPKSYLGLPTEAAKTVQSGNLRGIQQNFQNGTIFYSSKTGTHAIRGAIKTQFDHYGLNKPGFPTSDETKNADNGVWQTFQRGTFYWKSNTGAHLVANGFLTRYGQNGYEHGYLGYPTSDEYNDRGHSRQNFEHGRFWWNGFPNGSYSHYVQWAGQPNTHYCAPASGFMMMRNAGKWRAANGTSLSIDAMAAYMNTQWDGAHDGGIVNGLNNWLGRNAFQVHGYPDYNTLRYEVLHSFETDYAPMVLEHERRGGYHPNGHSNSTFSHAIVVDAYNTSDDSVLFDDPLASYGGAQKFWDHLGSFRQAYLLQSVDGDAPGIVSVK